MSRGNSGDVKPQTTVTPKMAAGNSLPKCIAFFTRVPMESPKICDKTFSYTEGEPESKYISIHSEEFSNGAIQ